MEKSKKVMKVAVIGLVDSEGKPEQDPEKIEDTINGVLKDMKADNYFVTSVHLTELGGLAYAIILYCQNL